MEKWINRFGSFWDYRESERPAQPYNPGKDRIYHLCFFSFASRFLENRSLKVILSAHINVDTALNSLAPHGTFLVVILKLPSNNRGLS